MWVSRTPKGSDLSGMLFTDRNNEVDIADVDTKGQPFTGSRSVELELIQDTMALVVG